MICHPPLLLSEVAFGPRARFHTTMRPFRPQSTVVDGDHEFTVSVDLPGVKLSDVSLTAHDGTVSIRASRRVHSSDGATVKKLRIDKSFALDQETVDISKIKANLSDGVLVVKLPKKAKPEPVVIAITDEAEPEPVPIEKQQNEAGSGKETEDSGNL
jgi:HSP20 family protein